MILYYYYYRSLSHFNVWGQFNNLIEFYHIANNLIHVLLSGL